MSITVTNRFQTSQYLQRLPNDFNTVKVKTESLKVQVLKRICRDIGRQFGKPETNLKLDGKTCLGYIKDLLDEELMDTKNILDNLVVLGNQDGAISGKIFNKSLYSKEYMNALIDHKQIDDKYPIFIDDSVSKYLDGVKDDSNISQNEFSALPSVLKPTKTENISEIQSALANKEIDFDKEVEYWMNKCFSLDEQYHRVIREKNEIIRVTIRALRSNSQALKLIKTQMIKTIPNRLFPVFEQRTQGITQLSKLYRQFEIIIKMNDQFPMTTNNKTDYNEANLNALKQRKKHNWHKHVNCFYCDQMGHLRRDCRKRDLDKKSRKSWMDKKSQQ